MMNDTTRLQKNNGNATKNDNNINNINTQIRPVLIDFRSGNEQICQSGILMNDVVLTILPPLLKSVENTIQNSDVCHKAKSTRKTSIACYDMENMLISDYCGILKVWSCSQIDHTVTVFPKLQFKLPHSSGWGDCSNDKIQFMLFKVEIEFSVNLDFLMDNLERLMDYLIKTTLIRGQEMHVIYTPFGVNTFANTCVSVSLCNTMDCLSLTDGRLTTGCEGAPVYTEVDLSTLKFPIGIILFPIIFRNQHSSYSVMAPLQTIIFSLLESITLTCDDKLSNRLNQLKIKYSNDGIPDGVQDVNKSTSYFHAMNNTVLVLTPSQCGTGIVLGQGLAITNAHVIDYNTSTNIKVNIVWNKRTIPAEVIFCTTQNSEIDIALLKYNKDVGPTGVCLASTRVVKGERVVALGYPLQLDHGWPTVTNGMITSSSDQSIVFFTSCNIYRGSSGGPVVNHNGLVVGICVAIVNDGSHLYPEVNMCIHANILETPIRLYQATGDITHLEKLETYESKISLRRYMNPASKFNGKM